MARRVGGLGVARSAVAVLVVLAALGLASGVPVRAANPPDGTTIDTVTVDTSSPSGANTNVPLIGGQTYLFQVSGTYEYGVGVGDAECTNTTTDATFIRDRFLAAAGSDVDSFQVQRSDTSWTPITSDANGCNTTDHRYSLVYASSATGAVNFRVSDGYYGDNSGTLTVQISLLQNPAFPGTLVDEFNVSADQPGGTTSQVVLTKTSRYRIQASGVFSFGAGSTTADPACEQISGAPGIRSTTANQTIGGVATVWANGNEVNWIATNSSPTGCNDTDHAYQVDLPANTAGRVAVNVHDGYYGDNHGTIHVKIFVNPTPAPSAVPTVSLVETVAVDSANPNGASSAQPLVAGQQYLFEVSGTYQYGVGVGDAECTTTTLDATFRPDRFNSFGSDLNSMQIQHADTAWNPAIPDATGCNSTDHHYRVLYTPSATASANFRISDSYYGDNAGVVSVAISLVNTPPQGTQIDAFDLDSKDSNGATSAVHLTADNIYRVQVTGNFAFGVTAVTADAACFQVAGAPSQRSDTPNRFGRPMATVGINRGEVMWASSAVAPQACNDTDHTYTYDLPGGSAGPLQVGVLDGYYGDNSGVLHVRVFVNPPSSAKLPQPSDLSPVETVRVDSTEPAGTNSLQPLVAGQQYVIEASGTYRYGAGDGDAECTTTTTDPTFVRDRYLASAGSDVNSLQVAGADVSWTPLISDAAGCNTSSHRYRLLYTPTTTGAVNFRVSDGFYGDNSGVLTVAISQTNALFGTPGSGGSSATPPVDQFDVLASNSAGTTSAVSLTGTDRYRVVVAGTYSYGVTGLTADAACVHPAGGPGARSDNANAVMPGQATVWVNGAAVTWVSTQPEPTGCNDVDFTYLIDLPTSTTGPITIGVHDGYYGDNSGVLHVKLYRNPTPTPSLLPDVIPH